MNAYRFSISWPRVLPEGIGSPSRGESTSTSGSWTACTPWIEPVATLYHWDLPQALHELGGWVERDSAGWFVDYAALMFDELGDGVTRWITHNEPFVTSFLGYAYGTKAPGRRDWREALHVAHHVLLSHGLAVRAFRGLGPRGGSIGISLDFWPAVPLSDSQSDREAVERWDASRNRWFLDPVLRGSYPAELTQWLESKLGPLELDRPPTSRSCPSRSTSSASTTTRKRSSVRTDATGRCRCASRLRLPVDGHGLTVVPDALHDLLVRLKREYGDFPIAITENGSAYDDPIPTNGLVEDPERLAYLRDHIEAVARAAAGVDVQGYFAWSLLDNFEWEYGYDKRFGSSTSTTRRNGGSRNRARSWYHDLIAGEISRP